MLIGKKWKVEADNLNIILYRYHKSKKGEDAWDVEGYYGTVAGALKGLVELQVRGTDLKDLQTVVEKIDALQKHIDVALHETPLRSQQMARKEKHD